MNKSMILSGRISTGPDGCTGDLAVIDAEGYCDTVGRVKDMIIRGGENIYPRQIEDYLFRHPKIQQAAVFGVPDDKYGEAVAARSRRQRGCSMKKLKAGLVIIALLAVAGTAYSFDMNEQDMEEVASNYLKYCALCHGPDREGHVNDHAPSLRSESLMKTGFPNNIYLTVAYGRPGTPMAGFLDEVGGPMSKGEIIQLLYWIRQESGVEEQIDLNPDPVTGDVELGTKLYAHECAGCHGAEGEGVTGTALGNPAMLSLTEDTFLRYAIVHGRDGTDMKAFGERLGSDEIDALTAFLRSRATGWAIKKPIYRAPPEKESYVINPDGGAPQFELKDDLYVMSADLHQALQDKRRMVILDTRIISYWQMVNIEGSVPMPYYYEFGEFDQLAADLPEDGTWIVTYCECPRAAAEFVNRKLKARGFKNTAVLWEGIMGWVGLGYPVFRGETTTVEVQPLP